jgi:hypothetical protein
MVSQDFWGEKKLGSVGEIKGFCSLKKPLLFNSKHNPQK